NPPSHFLQANRPTSSHQSDIIAEQVRNNQPWGHQNVNVLSLSELWQDSSSQKHQLEQQPIRSGSQLDLSKSPRDLDVNLQTAGNPVSHFLEASRQTSLHASDIRAQQTQDNQPWSHQNWNLPSVSQTSSELSHNAIVSDEGDSTSQSLKNNRKRKIDAVDSTAESDNEIDEEVLIQSIDDLMGSSLVIPDDLRLNALLMLYKQVGSIEVTPIFQLLSSFVVAAKKTYFLLNTKSPMSERTFAARLSHIIKASLLQIKTYAQLFKKMTTGDNKTLSELQTEAFAFLKFFWFLVLTGYADKKSKFYHSSETPAFVELQINAKNAFELPGKTYAKSQTASWHGTTAFFNFHWTDDVTFFVKTTINNKVISYAQKYNPELFQQIQEKSYQLADLHKKRFFEKCRLAKGQKELEILKKKLREKLSFYYSKILGQRALRKFKFQVRELLIKFSQELERIQKKFPERTPKCILGRISYILNATFIKIEVYNSLEKGNSPTINETASLEEELFNFLTEFCTLVLLDGCHRQSGFSQQRRRENELEALEHVRKILGSRGTSEEKAESASWVVASHFVNSYWKESLKNTNKKKLIKDEIVKMGKKSNIPYPRYLVREEDISEAGFQSGRDNVLDNV
ncbi:hypothetical protein O181_094794, partial [Austropuccinia psidii MF-1]|nr:hypothetical protein [Austropuccinia psidii MF-1]